MILYRKFLLLFIILPQLLWAQNVSPKIINDINEFPIEGVLIQYTDLNQQNQILFSDPNGLIELNTRMISTTDSLHIICLGYDQTTLRISDVISSKTIRLSPKLIVLDEVIITPINANDILQKAILNTKKKLSKEYPIEYTGILQYNTADNQQFKKNNLKYSAILTDSKSTKEKLPYILSLIDLEKQGSTQLDRLKDKDFYAWYHLIHMRNTIKEDYQVKLSNFSDNEVFILDCSPNKNSKQTKHLTFYINTNDTTINSINMDLIENLAVKSQSKKKGKYEAKILKEKFNIQFSTHNGHYYFSEGIYYNKIEYRDKENSDIIEYYQQIRALGFKKEESASYTSKKLSGYSREILEW